MTVTDTRIRALRAPLGLTSAILLILTGLAMLPGTPARAAVAAAATAPDPSLLGTQAYYAAGSCWEIKQARPSAPDGTYWLVTPAMAEPQQFYCDQTTDGGGWVLVGKGRNGWTHDDSGRGSAAALLNPGYSGSGADTHQYPARLVNGLLNGGRVQDLSEGVRLRRALNTTGTAWQEVRFKPDLRQTGWSWAFGARFGVTSWSFRPDAAGGTTAGFGGLTSFFGTGTTLARVRTLPTELSNYQNGFAYGDATTGTSASGSYLWSSVNGAGQAIPVTQVYLRPRVLSTDAGFTSLPAGGTPKSEVRAVHESDADPLPWGVAGTAGSTDREGSVEVQAFVQAGSRMYVGGNFRYVQRDAGGTDQVQQPFLAAFDVNTGQWISTFRPNLNEQVRALEVLPNGSIVAGGDFTSANGQPATAIVALNPLTGATDTSFRVTVENRSTGGMVRIWEFQRSADQLYIGGDFTHLTGGGRTSASYMRSLGRVRASDGRTENGWNPEMMGTVIDLDDSADGSRIYAAGFFNTSKGVPTRKAAAVLTQFITRPDGTVQHLADPLWAPVWSSTNKDYQQAIVEGGGDVWSGGSEHSIFGFDRNTFVRNNTTILHAKGDIQSFAVDSDDRVLYAGSHANNQYAYTDATTWSGAGPGGNPWTSAHTQHWIGAYDLVNGDALPDFAPDFDMRSGVWATAIDSNGRLWVGGDLDRVRTATQAGRWAGGFARFSERDSTAPATPGGFHVASSGQGSVTLDWTGVSDPSGVRYQVLRDDRPVAVTNQTAITLPAAGTAGQEQRYFVRAADGAGNVSASTPAVTTEVPPNQPPVAAFTAGTDRLKVTVDAGSSTDPENAIVGYAWTFGDGSTGTGEVAQHTYAGPGSYQVTLTVTDHEGLTDSETRTVQVVDAAPVTLVQQASSWTWRYAAGAPGTGWNGLGFDDSGWQQAGPAPLGFAPDNASGNLGTDIDTFATTAERPIAAYFRRTFQVADPGKMSQVVLRGVADDGAVFYVNGVEVGRQNMRDGTVTYTTYAPTSRRLSVAEADPVVLQVPAGLLVAGTNVIAGETHVNYRATPDLTFYASLQALQAQ